VTTIITKADFSCQHDGFFETTFDEHDTDDMSKSEKVCLKINKPEMKDFACQFDRPLYNTSNIIDIDDSLDIAKKKDIGTNPCINLTKDMSTDPMSKDTTKIHQLQQQVSELELLLLDKIGKDAALFEYEKEMKNLETMCGVGNMRYKKTKHELEELKMVLMMSTEEGNNLRMEIKQMIDNPNVDEIIEVLESNLGINSVMFKLVKLD
jgi:hypothetical protein